ncbi:MAG: AAA family ATPase [Paludibacteraceae bacterium]|nr:AAA family ATPase [Paludibacteraceae bacterium]MBR2493006.1 AAA family ATPase [Paludibacteraceae bacterium]MBR2891161.1 AAA family ATPase [Bacilli bacterium]
MRIKDINIVNFKGFENKTVVFNGNLTVVIGNNTAGKTTLLKALQVGLGAYLQSLKKLPGGTPYRRNFGSLDTFKKHDDTLRDYLINDEKPRITINADFPITQSLCDNCPQVSFIPVHWYREFAGNYTTHTRACAGELIDAVHQMENLRNEEKQKSVYPLVLSFGAKRTSDSQAKSTPNVKERASRIEKAYKFALHDKVDFEGAMEWLKHYDKDIRDKKEFEGTREAFYEALQTAIPALSEIDFDNGEIEAVVTVTGHTPSRHHFSYMSDGLQSMINIVSEIAHRCIELNGCLGSNAVKMTPGVVMIDEIDLYLHPHWQRHVLQDLTKAFPMIQFIVSTHSPFIVQSLKEGQLISFDDNALISGEPFRESLEDITSERMGLQQNIRSKRFNEMVDVATRLFEAADNGSANKDEIKAKLNEIEAEFSEDPAYLALIRTELKARLN